MVNPGVNPVVSRRDMLKRLSLAAGMPLLASPAGRLLAATHPGGAMSQPFQTELPRIPELKPYRSDRNGDYYAMTMSPAQVPILPGTLTTVWGFNGGSPGPTIRARRGRTAFVRQTNLLSEGVTIHLHGGHLPADMDGHPTDMIEPGQSKLYVYPNRQEAATLWYHDHAMDRTGPHVYRGLAGFYLIEDEAERGLGLPKGRYDVPIMIQDKIFEADGSLRYELDDMVCIEGLLGDTILVNGAVQPYMRVTRRGYRLRFLNASNARAYELALDDGRELPQIASDGGLLPEAVSRPSMLIAPGERMEVLIDFSYYPVGSRIVLQNRIGSGSIGEVMRFDVVGEDGEEDGDDGHGRRIEHSVLRPIRRMREDQASAVRRFVFAHGPVITDPWLIDGKPYDPARIDATVPLGAVEIWEFVSESRMPHPIHLHHVMFQVLSRNGMAPPPHEMGWKDTVVMFPGETVRVIARFTDYKGVYVFHCHMLEHEDFAMMGQFEVV